MRLIEPTCRRATIPRDFVAHPALPLPIGKRVSVLWRESVPATTGTALLVLRLLAAFPARVRQVLCGGAKKQVVGPHARGIVAAMADEQAIGNIAVAELPRRTVGARRRRVVPREHAVAGSGSLALPLPTAIAHQHATHEALQDRERLVAAALKPSRAALGLPVRGNADLASLSAPAAMYMERFLGKVPSALSAVHACQCNTRTAIAPLRYAA